MDPESSAGNQEMKPRDEQETSPRSPSTRFPIVGIGASAGGLEAFIELLKHLPADTGMAFVLVQHLAPQHESMLTEVLSRATRLPVAEVTEGLEVLPNHVYVIPPNTNMAIEDNTLRLLPRTSHRGVQMPIDYFLASLAEDRKDRAIGVILSGTASDGTLGLKAIKAEGGFTFAQDESAKYDSMPRSAIAAGYVDYVLSPQEIAKELTRIGQHPYVAPAKTAAKALPLPDDDLGKIFVWLRSATGVDFSHYKKATIIRRIKRRMVLRHIDSLSEYVAGLQNNRAELDALYRDILINVTSFFREPETFETLQRDVFPRLLADRPPEAPLRFWVPACSTGEEAYSIAMCALEFLRERESPVGLQIFATDISDPALEKARAGKYTEGEANEVGPERLERFFTRADGGYQVNKSVRDLCVFARQNIINDPPFSRLDLISCRNLLIYLDGSLQTKLLPIFHYSLRSQGFLVLGRSEGANEFSDLFTLIDRKGRIFAKKPKVLEGRAYSALNEWSSINTRTVAIPVPASREFDLQKEVTRTLLADYTPPGVVVNSDLEIVVLEYLGDLADHVSLHRYVGNQAADTPDFLALSNAIDRQIKEMDAVCRFVLPPRRRNERTRARGECAVSVRDRLRQAGRETRALIDQSLGAIRARQFRHRRAGAGRAEPRAVSDHCAAVAERQTADDPSFVIRRAGRFGDPGIPRRQTGDSSRQGVRRR